LDEAAAHLKAKKYFILTKLLYKIKVEQFVSRTLPEKKSETDI
jgi:hypothetical protein